MRVVFNALWFLLMLVVVGCAQGISSTGAEEKSQNSPIYSTVPTSGSIGTEGGGNTHTMVRVFRHDWDELADCIESIYPFEKDMEAKLEMQIFAQNLRDLSDRGGEVRIGNFENVIELDESTRNEMSRGRILLSAEYFQYDRFDKNIVMINYANRYGSTRLEWTSDNVGRAAYLCAPGTIL